MDHLCRVACLFVLFGANGVVWGQLHSTVQLPTFQQFSMTTTVVVPDRGGIYAGGVNRSWQASSRRGVPLLPNAHRSFDRGFEASGVSVHAVVHDLEEMDKIALSRWEDAKRKPVAGKPGPGGIPTSVRQPPISIRELRSRVETEEAASIAKAKADFQAGLKWQQKGRQALAELCFERALRRGVDGELREKIAARLRVASDPQLVSRKTD